MPRARSCQRDDRSRRSCNYRSHSYDAGSEVRIRLQPRADGRASIRYAGERAPIEKDIAVSGSGYVHLWNIPWEARTGRYQVDFTPSSGGPMQNAASFAVHRQLAKVVSVDLDKTFYTSGDSVSPRIVIRNVSNRKPRTYRSNSSRTPIRGSRPHLTSSRGSLR
jgi:hypothetical protein